MEKSKVFLFVHASKLFIYKTIDNVVSCNIIVDKRRSSQLIDPIDEEDEDQEVQDKRRRVNIKITF